MTVWAPYRINLIKQPTPMQIQYEDEEAQSLLSSQVVKESVKQIKPKVQNETPTPGELPKEIIHKVQYGDTLEGLSLEYEVPMSKIRYRNHIDGDAIYHLKEIVIPDPRILPLNKQRTEQMLIEEFVGHMDYSEKERKVAKYYLVDTDWQIEQALKEYREDLEWEKKNKLHIKSTPASGKGDIEMKQIKRFYDRMELMHKKVD